jgi:hypothetical protein
METSQRLPGHELSQAELRHFFLNHLNRIFCAKSQLLEKAAIAGQARAISGPAAGDRGNH